tara:strand:+ start:4739 stop:5881 length:1143 start_codon:yes stop_codon:yes gene_type:complete
MNVNLLFKRPFYTDVVLLYKEREDLLKKYVFGPISNQTIDVGKTLSLHPSVLLKTFKLIAKINFSWSLKVYIKQVYEAHLQALIETIAPKFVVTFIDDSGLFHRLSRKHKDIIYVAIQNGMRPKSHFDYLISEKLKSDILFSNAYYFCHGQSDVSLFKRYGYNIDKFFPVGSFVGGVYWNEVGKNIKPKYDICLVSCWVSDEVSNKSKDELSLFKIDKAGNKALEDNLKKIIMEKKYSVIVALKYENSEKEFNHFYNIFGDNVTYQHSSRKQFSTYEAIDQSRLAITLYSTCVAEAIGIGKRGLFSNGSGSDSIGIPSAGICYYEGDNYFEFKEKIAMLLNMSEKDFSDEISKDAKNLMNYDLNDLTHEKIYNFLLDRLN